MGDTRSYNNGINSNKNCSKKNSSVDKAKAGGKGESTRSRCDTNNNSNSNKHSKNRTGKKNVNSSSGAKNSHTKLPKQEIQVETLKPATSNNYTKSKMVDSTTQTSTPLKLHLDGMFEDTAGGYQRPSLTSVDSECIEDEENDEVVSEIGAPPSPLSSDKSSTRTSFSNKEIGNSYSFKFEWAQSPKKQQILIPAESRPRCIEDLENSHELKLLNLTAQLNDLVTTIPDDHQ